jgi:hypothetical protein
VGERSTVAESRLLFAPLFNLGGLTTALPQVIQFGSPYIASGHHFNLVNRGRVQRECTLHSHTKGNFPHFESGADAFAIASYYYTLEHLDPGTRPFNHLDVDFYGVASSELGKVRL